MSNVSAAIKSIQDIMRKDAGVDGDAQRIGQLVWMFFLKILDDKEQELADMAELARTEYRSPVPKKLQWKSWAADPEGMTGEKLFDFIETKLFPGLKNCASKGDEKDRAAVIRRVFKDANNYMKSGTLIRQAINKINAIDFNKSEDRHTFGDVYEQILKDLQGAGNAGEFYTPRAVTQFMVEMVDPKLSETVLDPACGTGGFLTHTIDHKADHYQEKREDIAVLQNSIRGWEKKALPHLLCTTNMMLHGIETPTNIQHGNTLSRALRKYRESDRVDVILTNPPFGGMEENGIENNFPKQFRTRETADLFLVLIIHLLRDGGRAAVVLPNGTLFGEGVKTRVKEKLLTECNLHTIVRLPHGVFNPYTGIRTNLLFFEKTGPTRDVWYYEHPYPKGYKSYGKIKPLKIEEFDPVKIWWNDRKPTKQAWKASAKEIRENGYNLDIPNPYSTDVGPRDPKELLEAYEANKRAVRETRAELKSVLEQSLISGGG